MKKGTQVSEKIPAANRQYKDTVFRMLFSEKENLLSLYNAVTGKAYQNADDLKIVTLENAIYMGMKNDLAFMLETNIYLYEHQSTLNPNIPLRDLIYIGIEYQQYVDDKSLYSSRLQKIPAPKFMVFYNGTDAVDDRVELRLSNAYEHLAGEPDLELKALMLKPVLIRHLTEKIIVMAQKCGMKIPKEKWLEKLDGFLDGYRGTVLFFREHKEKILILIVMTFVQRSSAFLLTFLVYLGFGLSGTAMYQILLLQAAIYVAVDMLPVPGAQGITEAMYGKVFLPVFSGQYLVPAMCVTRGVGFYLMLVIGALWVLKIHYKKIGSGRKKAYTNA